MKHVIRKNNYLIHLISHQKSNIEISDLSGHAASNFDPPLRHSTKDGLEVSCVSNDHSAISPAHWMLEFGERWRKHLGHSAKTEKEQYQRMETTSSTECLWTRCGRNALMTIVATSAVFGDSFFSRCGNLMSRWECWWSWGPEPKVLRKLSDTWMFPKTRVPQIFGFSDQGWMMLFLLVISGESG